MRKIMRRRVGEDIVEMRAVLNPAVRVVTDWKKERSKACCVESVPKCCLSKK
jgi:hypothetical protein